MACTEILDKFRTDLTGFTAREVRGPRSFAFTVVIG